MTELIERFFTIDDTTPATTLDEYSDLFSKEFENLWKGNPFFNPMDHIGFVTYMFLGALLTLPLTDITEKISIKDHYVNFDQQSIHVCCKIGDGSKQGKLIFRTVDLDNRFGDKDFAPEDELYDLIIKLRLSYTELSNLDINW